MGMVEQMIATVMAQAKINPAEVRSALDAFHRIAELCETVAALRGEIEALRAEVQEWKQSRKE